LEGEVAEIELIALLEVEDILWVVENQMVI
jgi:hypothetical protein